MGDRGAGESRTPSRSPGLLPAHGRRRRARRRRDRGRRVDAARGMARRAAISAAVAGGTGGGSLHQRAPADGERRAAIVRGCARPAVDRAANVAVLRDVRRPRRPRLTPRQLPGSAEPGRGASHIAHEHRTVCAVDGGGPGFRLARHRRCGRASRSHTAHDERSRALSRALLQLV